MSEKCMRFSPVLLAVLSVSATVGWSVRPAIAETGDAAEIVVSSAVADQIGAPSDPAVEQLLTPATMQIGQASAGSTPEATSAAPAPSEADEQVPTFEVPATPVNPTIPPPSGAPIAPPTPPSGTTGQPQPPEEPRVEVAEVVVSGAPTPELERIVYDAIQTKPGQTTTRTQLQQDRNAVFATGYFANVQVVPEDTPLGVRVTFVVTPNPVLQSVRVEGAQVLPNEIITQIFSPQYGQILNLREFQRGIEALNRWYRDNGYVLAQVVAAPQVSADGTVTLTVAEGVIEDINVRFLDQDGNDTNERGEPIRGRTRPFIITREFRSQPGQVFNQSQIQADLQRAFGLGIFEDLRVSLNPGSDPRKVDVTVNVVERNTGSVAAGAGISSASGLFGTISYQEQNLGGNNQRLAAEIQFGQRDLLFDIGFTDPWIAGDPFRTSYSVSAFARRTIPLVFQGGETEVFLPNGDRPRVRRFGGGISFARPDDAFEPNWRFSTGIQYQNVRIQDADGDRSPVDELGNDLSFSGTGVDDLFLVSFSASTDRRNNRISPTSGYTLRLSTEQSIPIGQGSILLNRLRGNYSFFIPVNWLRFSDGPQTLAFNVQGGLILGDLPPYEAFSLGGTDSIRGYDPGDVGSGRAFLLGSIEYRFPIFSIVGGALFVDVGSTLGTDRDVPGEPSIVRDKPGSGLGFGVGVRVQSPLGVIRVDYAINDEGDSQIHFGLGERF